MPDVIGSAFRRHPTGDLIYEENEDGSRSLQRVEGLEEFKQALIIGFLTRRGEDPIVPEYGLPAETISGLFRPSLIASIIRGQINLDNRVRRVQNLEVIMLPADEPERVARVQGTVLLKDGNTMSINQAFAL